MHSGPLVTNKGDESVSSVCFELHDSVGCDTIKALLHARLSTPTAVVMFVQLLKRSRRRDDGAGQRQEFIVDG